MSKTKTKEHKDEREEKISKSMEGNQNALKYEGEKTDKLIFKLCLLGKTDAEIADLLDISVSTLNNWKIEYPSVLESIRNGKENADINVVQSMYKRAIGFEHKVLKTAYNPKLDRWSQHEVLEYVIPDVTAQKKFLSARQPKVWSERLAVNGGTDENGDDKPIKITLNLGKEI